MFCKVKKLVCALCMFTSHHVMALDVIPDEFIIVPTSMTHKFWLTKAPEISAEDKHCMALNLWHEARHEPEEGLVAVAQVVLNRVEHADFPDDICSVVYQRSRKNNITTCQFTWTCQQLRQPRPDEQTWIKIVNLVDKLFQGYYRDVQQIYNNSLNYHAYYVNPRWNLKKLKRIGAHIFYQRY